MKITHICHSCFLVELDHTLLLFDYFQGPLPPLDAEKTLFVFSSHRHHDHYSPAVWELNESHPNVFYVLDENIPARRSANVLPAAPRSRYDWQGLHIETLRSTDEGCAFLVRAEGLWFYHAGDLNWWHWEGEPDQQNAWHDKAFHEELDRIRGRFFDAAFVPLDPRQEENAWWGFVDFLKACRCDNVFPMHCFDNRAGMLAYLKRPELAPYLARIRAEEVWQG
ncbi:MBL fold metallo-hydrolase [Gemmiger sp. An50]|uniref:MBL fold metallo-hydrolase n=1 Tax=Gemmiger sp. An50 TaxID=1965639 RepID=UPI000B383D30|nr:MBL fold metallo-hydrolase [Gemmiger sp. An50]OUN83881.1 hypothetical protein B5G03_13605 [Gemmiger sp. An50]